MLAIDDSLLDGLEARAAGSPRLRAALDLRTTPGDGSQRMLNALLPGTDVPIHRHPVTAETVLAVRGALTEVFYDGQGVEMSRHPLDAAHGPYGLQIPPGQWHTVEVTSPCVILEVKDGPYAPAAPEDMMNL